MNILRLGAVTASLTCGLALTGLPAQAATPQAATPIGPNQIFHGLVNGSTGAFQPAVVQMGCFGPIRPGQTGHPLAGQTLSVTRALDLPGDGNTGAAGRAVVGNFNYGPAVAGKVKFAKYDVKKAIPKELTLPCSGTGAVLFTPVPTSIGAAPSLVPVTFVGQP